MANIQLRLGTAAQLGGFVFTSQDGAVKQETHSKNNNNNNNNNNQNNNNKDQAQRRFLAEPIQGPLAANRTALPACLRGPLGSGDTWDTSARCAGGGGGGGRPSAPSASHRCWFRSEDDTLLCPVRAQLGSRGQTVSLSRDGNRPSSR